MDNTQKFELWAIVELFGHQKMSGKVIEQSIGIATFIRVDVPETTKQPSYSRLLNPSAIYAINPVSEDVARVKAEQFQTAPIDTWDAKAVFEKLKLSLPAKANDYVNPDDDLSTDDH